MGGVHLAFPLVVVLTGTCISGGIFFWLARHLRISSPSLGGLTIVAGFLYIIELLILALLIFGLGESPTFTVFIVPLLVGVLVIFKAAGRTRLLLSWFLGALLGSLAAYLYGLFTISGPNTPTSHLASFGLQISYIYFGFVLGPAVSMLIACAQRIFTQSDSQAIG